MDLKIYREHDFNTHLSGLVSDIIISDGESQIKFSERDLPGIMSRFVEIKQEIQRANYGPIITYGDKIVMWNGHNFHKI